MLRNNKYIQMAQSEEVLEVEDSQRTKIGHPDEVQVSRQDSVEEKETNQIKVWSISNKLKQVIVFSAFLLFAYIAFMILFRQVSFQKQSKTQNQQKQYKFNNQNHLNVHQDNQPNLQLNFSKYKDGLDQRGYHNLVSLPKYAKFNYNLAHYLLQKKKIKKFTCLQCTDSAISKLKQLKFYQLMAIKKDQINNSPWIHLYYQKFFQTEKDVQSFLELVAKYDSDDTLGVSVFCESIKSYNHSSKLIKDTFYQGMVKINLYYMQQISLNLRVMQGGIILIFQKTKPIFKSLPFNSSSSKTIGFQSVFRMTQNLPFLREWFAYHINIGISNFFIYDNEGTSGYRNADAENTKYGVSLSCLDIDEAKRIRMFDQIWEQFEEYIVYIPWQPTKKGKIIYDQYNATYHYLRYFQDVTKYTLFTDFDEFVFSPKDLNLVDYVLTKQKQGIISFTIKHFKMQSRFCLDRKLVIEGNLGIQIDGIKWGPKILVLNTACKQYKVHYMKTKFGRHQTIDEADFRFYHFNLIESQIYNGFAQQLSNTTTTHIDDSLQRYLPMLKAYCKDKCSDSYHFACPLQQRHKDNRCPQLKTYK